MANGGTTHTGTYDDFHLKDPVVCNFTYVHIIMMMKIPFFYPNLSHISLPILFWFQPTYRLHIGKYNGTIESQISLFPYHNNMAFTTLDHDQDNSAEENCAVFSGGKGFEYQYFEWNPHHLDLIE